MTPRACAALAWSGAVALLVGCDVPDLPPDDPGPHPCELDPPGAEATLPVGEVADGQWVMTDGKLLVPAGEWFALGGWATDVAVHPTGRWVVAAVGGLSDDQRGLVVIETEQWTVTDELGLDGTFMGLLFDDDGERLWVAGSDRNEVVRLAFQGGELTQDGIAEDVCEFPIALQHEPGRDRVIAVCNVSRQLVLLDPETLAFDPLVDVIDVSSNPYEVVVLPERDEVYVSGWTSREVLVVDLDARAEVDVVPVGKNPQGLAVDPDSGMVLVVATDHDSLAVIDPAARAVTQTLPLDPALPDLYGGSPSEVAVDAAARRVYVPHGKENRVAVYDADTLELLGSIPTQWYPTAVALCADCPGGPELVLTSGKGTGAGPRGSAQSIRDTIEGSFGHVPVPGPATLEAYSEAVAEALQRPRTLHDAHCPHGTWFPVPTDDHVSTPITHVIVLMRENKTFDAELGDAGLGDGDPSLVMYDETMTPNLRALAARFTLLDNYYQLGEVSLQGHQWAVYGMTNDYMERLYDFHDEFVQLSVSESSQPENVPIYVHLHEHGVPVISMGQVVGSFELEGVLDMDFPGIVWSTAILDEQKAAYVVEQIEGGDLPPFTFLVLPNNHTVGTTPGQWTPEFMVADNDHATGMVVEALTHSEIWPTSVLFIFEDDAIQGGDHVAAHRSPLVVVSPYAKRGYVSSVQASTPSVHATIERIFGAPPMNRFDAAATPLYDAFTTEPDYEPYTALPRQIDEAFNPAGAEGAEKCAQMDFSIPDQAHGLNDVLWRHLRGTEPPWSLDGEPLPFDEEEAEEEREKFEAFWARHPDVAPPR